MTERPNLDAVLSTLKDFQRRSAEYAFRRLYKDEDAVDRFLIADEVGLGKTLVARGVIALAVNELWDRKDIERIDVVYICSSGDIARQNLNRLALEGYDRFSLATRLTLLPLQMKELGGRRLNFVSFTPSTSFDLRSSTGVKRERALLYVLLERAALLDGLGVAPKNVLQGGAGADSWRGYLDWFRTEIENQTQHLDEAVVNKFAELLKKERTLKASFLDACDRFARVRENPPSVDRQLQSRVIADLRRLLAKCCVEMLEPDLVLLDEFQRFKNILDDTDDEIASLARQLFDWRDAKVLMLSATPYKMYTTSQESDDDHYADFLRTTEFLFRGDNAELSRLKEEIRRYRIAISTTSPTSTAVGEAKTALEKTLRKVMCRTERLAVTADRNGMLGETPVNAALEASDVRFFRSLDAIGRAVGVHESIELWKSAPYLLNLMDEHYQFKRKLKERIREGQPELRKALAEVSSGLLRQAPIESYEPLDPGNPRMRVFIDHAMRGAELLWIPACAPYYLPRGAYAVPSAQGFTKQLVFSSWHVVPKAIAALTSYEAERRVMGSGGTKYSQTREVHKGAIRFSESEDRLTAMSSFTLLYPSVTLAEAVDPLAVARNLGSSASAEAVLETVKGEIARLLEPILIKYGTDSAREDESWYWAAPILLDRARLGEQDRWLEDDSEELSFRRMLGDDQSSAFQKHVHAAASRFSSTDRLGRPPADLAEILARMALGSPAITSLRALSRRWAGALDEHALRSGAARAAIGFVTLYNQPEATLLIRQRPGDAFWVQALEYAIDGNLQAVMDEYVHVLTDAMGLSRAPHKAALEVGQGIHDAASLRAIVVHYDEISAEGERVEIKAHRLRCRYALRFGQGDVDEDNAVTRDDHVRAAFNSPFRPFVLASTSVGQEGLDFHLYCHHIWHWNLPSNPVDLEQREGRVHRYKCHVVRKNLAARGGDGRRGPDPWEALFDSARSVDSELVPYWVYEGTHRIERHVPMLPLSREVDRFVDLKRSLAQYRMVFGQPRQQDLLEFLQKIEVSETDKAGIDLSPWLETHA
jgi:hypothetical protein